MLSDSGIPLLALKVDGGMTSNNLLMQGIANVLDVPVERPMVSETVSLGAAYAAGLAVGYWPEFRGLTGCRKTRFGRGRGRLFGGGWPGQVLGCQPSAVSAVCRERASRSLVSCRSRRWLSNQGW